MTTSARRRLLVAAATATTTLAFPVRRALAQATVQAGGYPSRALKIIVASPPGGLMDNYARMYAEHFTARTGQPAVVENRPGASGIVAIEAMTKSPPDGYTVLLGSTGMFFQARILNRKLPYDLDRDVVPIAVYPTGPLVLAATEKSGIRDFKGMLEYAKKQRVNMGNYVVGSYQQILAETWNRELGTKFDLVHYKGEVPMWVDMASGQLDVSIGSYQAFANVRDKGLRAIGVTGKLRSPRLPDVPTMVEQGFSGPISKLEAAVPMVTNAGVPAEILDLHAKLVVETNDTPKGRAMKETMAIPDPITGRADAQRLWKEDGPVWIREVQALNLKID